MTHTQDLLPCPFCGGAAIKHRRSLDERFAYADQVSIRCRACGIELARMGDIPKGGYADNSGVDAAAIAAWNRRVPAPAVPDDVAGLRWNKTLDGLPKKPGKSSYERVECLIVLPSGDIQIALWNCEHECWDDEYGDDFLHAPCKPTHWMPIAPIRAALTHPTGGSND